MPLFYSAEKSSKQRKLLLREWQTDARAKGWDLAVAIATQESGIFSVRHTSASYALFNYGCGISNSDRRALTGRHLVGGSAVDGSLSADVDENESKTFAPGHQLPRTSAPSQKLPVGTSAPNLTFPNHNLILNPNRHLTLTTDVKTFFFTFFYFPNVFYFLKKVGKVQSSKQINKKHFIQ